MCVLCERVCVCVITVIYTHDNLHAHSNTDTYSILIYSLKKLAPFRLAFYSYICLFLKKIK